MVKSPEGTCVIPLTEGFVSTSGVSADEFYKLLWDDKGYSHFQQQKRDLDFSQEGVKPVPLCSLEQSEKVLLGFVDDGGPVQVAVGPAAVVVASFAAVYYTVCTLIQIRSDNLYLSSGEINNLGVVGLLVWNGVCLPVSVAVNIPLRLLIKGDVSKTTPYN